jgi:hypothetical protein
MVFRSCCIQVIPHSARRLTDWLTVCVQLSIQSFRLQPETVGSYSATICRVGFSRNRERRRVEAWKQLVTNKTLAVFHLLVLCSSHTAICIQSIRWCVGRVHNCQKRKKNRSSKLEVKEHCCLHKYILYSIGNKYICDWNPKNYMHGKREKVVGDIHVFDRVHVAWLWQRHTRSIANITF